jgi:hypothetical protein
MHGITIKKSSNEYLGFIKYGEVVDYVETVSLSRSNLLLQLIVQTIGAVAHVTRSVYRLSVS